MVMARPATGRNGKPKRLYLNEDLVRRAEKHCFQNNKSLSEYVSELMARSLAAQKSSRAA